MALTMRTRRHKKKQHTTPSIAEQLYSRVTLKKNTDMVKAVDVPDKAPRARIAALFLSPQLQNRLHSQAARTSLIV